MKVNFRSLTFRRGSAGLVAVAVVAGWAALSGRPRRGGAAADPAAGAAPVGEVQSVAVFVVERSSFTDSIDGLVGTVKGDTIELTFGGQEEPLIAVHVKVGQAVKKGELLFELDHTRARARKDQAEIAFERARQMRDAGAATARDVREAESAHDIARRDYEDTFIRAPKAGTVSEIAKQVGETAGRNESLGVLVSSQDALRLETAVIEGQLDRVAEGQAAWVRIEALGGQMLRGSVQGVSREVTTTGRTGAVVITLPKEAQAKLRPGQSARCRIVVFDQAALLAPRQAYDPDKRGVYVVKDGRAAFRSVELGHLSPEYYEIKTGLNEGERIVRDLVINPVEDGAAVSEAGDPERYAPAEEPAAS